MLHVVNVLAWIVALAGCTEPRLEWRATFATEPLSLRASKVRYSIERGSCATPETERREVWFVETEPAATITPPGALGPGDYAFRVVARDERCVRFAEGCRDATLPRDDSRVEVLVGHVAPTAAQCPAGQSCLEGECRSDLRLPRWDCPDGWAPTSVPDRTLGSVAVCEPFAPRLDCPEGRWQLPGERACTRPGGATCDDVVAGGWPRDVPVGARYVLPGEGTSGDGSREAPLRDLTTVLADAPEGSTIVAVGTFPLDRLVVPRGVTLLGSCERTRILLADPIVRSDDRDATTLKVYGGALRNLYVIGGAPGVRVVGSAVLDGVVVERASGLGVVVEAGAVLTADEGGGLVVRGTRFSDAIDPSRNRAQGLSIGGLSASIRRLVAEGNEGGGISVQSGAEAVVADSVIRGTDGNGWIRISTSLGRLTRIVVEDGDVLCDAGTCEISDLVLRAFAGRPAVLWSDEGDLGVERAWVTGGVLVSGVDPAIMEPSGPSNAILRDVVLLAPAGGTYAIDAVLAGDLRLDRFVVSGGDQCAISVAGALRASLTDGVILHSPAGVCSDVGLELDRCDVSALDVARDRRVSGVLVEACDGCDSDGDHVDDDTAGEAVCAELTEYDVGPPECRRTGSSHPATEPVYRCCIPMPEDGCDYASRYDRETTLASPAPEGADAGIPLTRACCTP